MLRFSLTDSALVGDAGSLPVLATAQVIAQKLQQTGHVISIRSVKRVIADYGLQKKTLRP
jgi:hypothetical protein